MISCECCGKNHKFEECPIASPEHLIGSVEMMMSFAVNDYNALCEKHGDHSRMEKVGSSIKQVGRESSRLGKKGGWK